VDSKVVAPAPSAPVIPAPAPAPEPAKQVPAGDAAKPAAPKTDPAKPAATSPPATASGTAAGTSAAAAPSTTSAVPATLVFAIQPWGEIFVNGKSQGVTPPKKNLKLDPGKYKIEIRNTTFPVHVENLDLKPRDEVTVRHRFQ